MNQRSALFRSTIPFGSIPCARKNRLHYGSSANELELRFGRGPRLPKYIPGSDCANIRASTAICLRSVLSWPTGIESPCFNAFRLERALPAEVFGPRPSKPLRLLAAICLSVAILRFPQWF